MPVGTGAPPDRMGRRDLTCGNDGTCGTCCRASEVCDENCRRCVHQLKLPASPAHTGCGVLQVGGKATVMDVETSGSSDVHTVEGAAARG
jgi:hypothetical protein